MTTISVSSSAELLAAYESAQDGDRIELQPGVYESVTLSGRNFETLVTITSADSENQAQIESLKISLSENIELSDLVIGPEDSNDLGEIRLQVLQSSNIDLSGLTVYGAVPDDTIGLDPSDSSATRDSIISGYAYDFGVWIQQSDNVTFSDSSLSKLRIAAYVEDSSAVTISGLDVSDVREGIQFTDSSDLTITGSYFHDFSSWVGMSEENYDSDVHDHPDMIQYWGIYSTDGLHDITISENVFSMPEWESTQTIFGHMGSADAGVTATNFMVTDNLILNGQVHGITLYDVQGGEISGNVLLPNTEAISGWYSPRVLLSSTSTDLLVTDNVFVEYSIYELTGLTSAEQDAQNVVVTDSNVELSNSPTAEDYWATWWESYDVPEAWSVWLDTIAEDTGSTEIQEIFGTSAAESLNGSSGSDVIFSNGGNGDILWGGSGDAVDYFVFGAETQDGQADFATISDFRWETDMLLLADGAEIDRIIQGTDMLAIRFTGDYDGLQIYGEGITVDTLAISTFSEVFGEDSDGSKLIERFGTSSGEQLIGTEASEVFYPGGGINDIITGGDGAIADYFVIEADVTSNGIIESAAIIDFQWQYDALILEEGVTINRIIEGTDKVVLRFDGDLDAVSIYGSGITIDNLTIGTPDDIVNGTTTATDPSDEIDDPTAPEVLTGTDGAETLTGSTASEVFYSGGGSIDRMSGGSGDAVDYFVFGDETQNGVADWDIITDFQWENDVLVLDEGTTLSRVITGTDMVAIRFNGDYDALLVYGEGLTSETLSIVDSSSLDFMA